MSNDKSIKKKNFKWTRIHRIEKYIEEYVHLLYVYFFIFAYFFFLFNLYLNI